MLLLLLFFPCRRLTAPPDARRGETERSGRPRRHRVEAEVVGGRGGVIRACGGGGGGSGSTGALCGGRSRIGGDGSAVDDGELPSDDAVANRPGPDDAEAGGAVEREPLYGLKPDFF